jgi:hypothetical protein
MDPTTSLLLLVAVAAIGILAVIAIMRRRSIADATTAPESPFAASTEGMKRCPSCGVGNLVTESNCSNCGKRLPN